MWRHTAQHPLYNSGFHSSPRLKTVKGMLKQQGIAQVGQEGEIRAFSLQGWDDVNLVGT